MNSDEKVCPFCAETIKSAAWVCRYCRRELSGAPTSGVTAPVPPRAAPQKQSGASKVLLTVGVLGVMFFALVQCGGSSPGSQERREARSAIELCWSDQKRKSLDPGSARFVASVCEKMESDFRSKYNASP